MNDLDRDPWVRTGLDRFRLPGAVQDRVHGPVEAVCDVCRAEQHRWLDAPAVPRPMRIITIGTDSVMAVSGASRAFAEDHYDRIRTQQTLIATACRAARHARTAVADVLQLPQPEIWEQAV